MPLNMARGAFVRVFPLVLSLTAGLWGCGGGPKQGPEAKRPIIPPAAVAQNQMVAAANPLAAEAGLRILRDGGSAVDAAIAAQMALAVVEPQSSGIGGGGFLVSYARKNGDIDAYDGRATAPASSGENLFLDKTGKPLPWLDANIGGRAVGVPGLVAMLRQAHRDHGKLPWDRLFKPAIDLARDGFPVGARLHAMIAAAPSLKDFPESRALYLTETGSPKPIGAILKNVDLADTLAEIAKHGPKAFYRGKIAKAIAKAVTESPKAPAVMTVDDIKGYGPVKRPALCGFYRVHLICGAPPPSSGGIAVLQVLGMLQGFDISGPKSKDAKAWHLILEASRLAFADRDTYVADPAFAAVPTQGLLDPNYLSARAAEIDPSRDRGAKPLFPGVPVPADLKRFPANPGTEETGHSTTHLSVIDRDGNAVALTSSLNIPFGSRITVKGFPLNSELADFDFTPVVAGGPAPNRVEPGKRPRSSMSPTLVLGGDGSLVMTVGAVGGSNAIGHVLKTLVGVLDWDLDMQEAVSLGSILNKNGATMMEDGAGLDALGARLAAMGHETKFTRFRSGLHGIRARADGTLEGGADHRQDGVALGD